MSRLKKYILSICMILLFSLLYITTFIFAQDETNDTQIIERYKLMLNRKPREGSTFDRLYQFYLEGPGLDTMVSDYQDEVNAKPNDANVHLILGHLYKRLGKDKDALTTYQKVVTLSPNNYYAHFALGKMYVTLRQHENAIEALNKSTSLSEQSQSVSPEELTDIYKTLGNAYFNQDKLEDAIQIWEKIAVLDPENVFARIELADLFREKELYPQAIAQHQAIIDYKKDDPYRRCLSLREIGKLHEATAKYQEAQKYYDMALDLTTAGNWLRKDLQFRIIALYSADANWKDLITYYQGKLENNANDPEYLSLLASAYVENQDIELGISTYKKGIELAPTDSNLRLQLIGVLKNTEKYEEAAAEYEILSQQQPDDFGIYRELGKLYIQLESEDKAKTTYQRMIERDPQNASTFITLAEIYTKHEWLEDAADAYQKAIALAPQNLDYIEYYGEFYYRQGNREKAVEIWNQIVAADKSLPENYDRLARIFESKKFTEQAIETSRKAVELMPEGYRFREALAQRLMNNKHYDDALAEYTEAIKHAPNEFFAEKMDDQRIEIYRRKGTLVKVIEETEIKLDDTELTAEEKYKQLTRLAKMYIKSSNITYALEILLQAKELLPNDIPVSRLIAELYTKQRRRDEAIEIYKHLVEIDNKNAREYHANIANAYLNGFDFEEATEAAKQVIANSPRNPEGHELLAKISKQSDNLEDAVESYKQAVRLRPESIEIRTELASIYKLMGNTREAIAQYWRCWEVSDNVSDRLSFIKPLTDLYFDLGRSSELQEKLRQMANSDTAGIAPVLALAQVYRMEGDLPNARFQLARALDRQRDNTELLSQLVDINLDLGEIQEALTYQQMLVKANPDPLHQQKLGELLYDVGREQEAVQAWSKVLHMKNQSTEAKIKLANLLIRHGLIDEALFALNSAAENISGMNPHLSLYQIGTTFVEINENDRAVPVFQSIIDYTDPVAVPATTSISGNQANNTSSPTNVQPSNVNKITLTRNILNKIQRQTYQYTGQSTWYPNNFDEAQAGALIQLKKIYEDQGKLNELIDQFENNATENENDIVALEQLAQLYIITGDDQKTEEITEKLIAALPNDPVYQGMQIGQLQKQTDLNYDTLMTKLNEFTWVKPEARQSYILDFIRRFHSQDKLSDAEKLFNELDEQYVVKPNIIGTYVNILSLFDKSETIENVVTQYMSTLTPQLSQKYAYTFQNLASIFLNNGKVDKSVQFSWLYLENSKPKIFNPRRTLALRTTSQSGISQIQAAFPSPTIYYDNSRLRYLQQVFNHLWINDRHQVLYTLIEKKIESSEGIDKVYPALALCYCKWWENKRDQSLEILSNLQQEFSEDFTLKINTALVSIQIGEHKAALKLLNDLSTEDPRNRRQYHDLTLQIAVHIGDIVTVRDLMSKILNSPSSVQELYRFSQKLQQAGLTQFAIAVAKKTMTLAMRERDVNFLLQLSQHLSQLGRGQDAAKIATRALNLANQHNQHGQTFRTSQFQQAARLANRSVSVGNTATKLIEATEKNPKSVQAHLKLASFYEGRSQINQASVSYETALKLRPNDHTTRLRYAQMLQRNRRLKDAVKQFTILLKDKNSQAIYSSYWETIRTFLEAGEANQLVTIIKDMIKQQDQYSRMSHFAQNTAQEFIRRKNQKGAIEIYEHLMEAGNDYIYSQLADAYTSAGQKDKAKQLYRDKLKTVNNQSKVNIVLSLANYDDTTDELKALSAEYEKEIAAEKVDPSLLYLAAVTKIALNEIEEADPIVDKLIENIPSRFKLDWLNIIANTYKQKKDIDREIRVLEAATENVNLINSWMLWDTYRKLGTAYKQKGQNEKAKDYIIKMGTLRLMQNNAPAFWEKEDISRTYMQYQLYDEAEILLNEIMNDPSVYQHYRERAREQLTSIKQRRDGNTGSTSKTPKSDEINITLTRSMAQEHMNRDRIPEAIELYEQIAKVMPEDLESRSKLAGLYSRQNQHENALKIWKELLETDSENTKYQDGIITAYERAGRLKEAIELAQKYIQQDAETGIHYSRLAKLYNSNGQQDLAITTYKKALELSPGDVNVLERLGRLYMSRDDLENAEQTFKEALEFAAQTGQNRNIERQLIEIYRRKGTLEQYLTETDKKGGLSYDLQKELARTYLNQGKLDEASKVYEKALQSAPHEWEREEIERQLISIYRKQGNLEEKLNEAEKKGTLSFGMQLELARQYKAKGDAEKAIETYKTALSMTTRGSERERVYNQLIQEYVQQGEDDTAIDLYDAMKQNRSGSVSTSYSSTSGFVIEFGEDKARETLIKAYKSQGRLERLRKYFETKLESDNNNPNYLEIIAGIYRTTEDYEKGSEAYKALSQADPTNVRSFYYAAEAYNRIGNKDMAEKMLAEGEQALLKSSRNHDMSFLSALGSICYKNKMYDVALKLFKDALNSVEHRYSGYNWNEERLNQLIGSCALATEKYEDAVEAFKEVKRITRDSSQKEIADQKIKKAFKEGKLYEKLIPEQLKKIEGNPDDADTRVALAENYELADMYEKAIEQYEKISELEPDKALWHKKIGELYAKTTQTDKQTRLEKAAAAYQSAISVDPNSYQLYTLLAKTHEQRDDISKAEEVYRQALKAPLKSSDHDAAVKAIIALYEGEENVGKRLEILKELGPKTTNSPFLQKSLGDAYVESGDAEKAAIAYRNWLEIYKSNTNPTNNPTPSQHRHFHELTLLAEKLLNQNVLPEFALELAKEVIETNKSSINYSILAQAYLVNEEYDKALEQFQTSFNIMKQSKGFSSPAFEQLMKRITDAGKLIEDKTHYIVMLNKLADSIPISVINNLNVTLTLAKLYQEIEMTENAAKIIMGAGFFPEIEWLTLGPFDNTKSSGYNTEFITEETTEIDPDATYDGVSGKISWQKASDELLDGFFAFGLEEKPFASYAWITFTSPEEREAQIRFDSDDQGKVWLNAKKVYAHRRTRGARIDRRSIPVTLNAGENSILVKVCNESLPWGFYLRITDTDGQPYDDLKIIKQDGN